MAVNIQRFLNIMRARRRWEAWFGAAIAPDSNLNAASGERTIFLDTPFGRLPFTLDDPATPESGLGLSLWGGGEYQYPLAPRWRLRSGANASVREYKGGDFDRHSLAAHLGPRRLIDARTEASLLATVDRQWTPACPRPTVSACVGSRTPADAAPLRVRTGERRAAQLPRLQPSRRPEGDVLLGAVWAALPILRFSSNASWNWSRANSEHWRNSGPRAGLGATLALPAGFTVGLRASLQRTEYQGRGFAHNTIDREPREDETQTLSISVHNRAFTLAGFSPRLSLIREERKTNAQALDYDRNRAELSFVQQF